MKNIRSSSIITHIDHGKSTLSDHIIQICGSLSDREIETQVFDSMGLERERGITIKAQSVTLGYKTSGGKTHQLNFTDTPDHIDFFYEAPRSLAACKGALSVVDAGQGVEAQTLADCYTAMEADLEAVLVLNKINSPTANPEYVVEEAEDIVSIDTTDAVRRSAKTGVDMQDALGRLVCDIPPPEGDPEGPLQILTIDSWSDNYPGVVLLIRVKNGTLYKGDKVKVMSTGQTYNADRLDILTPKRVDHTELKCDGVGWLVCATKDIRGTPASDTLTLACNPAEKALPGFKKAKPQVHAGLFPVNSDDYEAFRGTLGKLSLNDASLFYRPESPGALGFGFHRGFLGLLRMEIIQERLEYRYDLDLTITAPAAVYEVETMSREVTYVNSSSKPPAVSNIYRLREPIAECHMLLSQTYLGNVITLYVEKRGVQTNTVYHDSQVTLMYEIPTAEVALDFFDHLESTSRGYASLNYNSKRSRASDMVHVGVLINGEHVDALTLTTYRDNSRNYGRGLMERVKDLVPRQQFNIVIQATTGMHTTARSTVKQLCKDVLTKYYGGDTSRKKKLLQKQREGKKRMKQTGNVELPQEALLAILHVGKDNK